jgi:DNA polymerase-3 subunit alpha
LELADTQAGTRQRVKEMHRLNAKMTTINQAKVRFATEMGVPLVVVNDSHHAYPQDWYNRELVWQFNTGKNPDQVGDVAQKADHLMGDEELYLYMRRHDISDEVIAEAIKNSHQIASSCQVEIKPTLSLPKMAATPDDDFRNSGQGL